jgi:hypothetical protein
LLSCAPWFALDLQDLNISNDVRLLRGGVEMAQAQARSDRTLGKAGEAAW